MTDTLGLMIGLVVHGADVQDRDGALDVLRSVRHRYPWLRHVFSDSGYASKKLKGRLSRMGQWTIEIIKRTDKAIGFEPLPRRSVVNACTMLPSWVSNGRLFWSAVDVSGNRSWLLRTQANVRFDLSQKFRHRLKV